MAILTTVSAIINKTKLIFLETLVKIIKINMPKRRIEILTPSAFLLLLFRLNEDNVFINAFDDLLIKLSENFESIYYIDFDNADKIKYEVYLVKNNEDYIKLNTTLIPQDIDYKKELGSSFNLDHICFEATGDITDLDGEYTIYVKIINGDYIDICEINNLAQEEFNPVIKELKTYQINTSNIRKRLILSISGE